MSISECTSVFFSSLVMDLINLLGDTVSGMKNLCSFVNPCKIRWREQLTRHMLWNSGQGCMVWYYISTFCSKTGKGEYKGYRDSYMMFVLVLYIWLWKCQQQCKKWLTSPLALQTLSTTTRAFKPFTTLSKGFLPDSRKAVTKKRKMQVKLTVTNHANNDQWDRGLACLPLSLSRRYTAAYQLIVSKHGWRNFSGVFSCLSSLYTLNKKASP